MKRTLLAIAAAFVITLSAGAQRLSNVTAEARFITDKMMVELGLDNTQCGSILQLNLNYLNGIGSYRDISADGWKYRNRQLKKLLTARQWKLYRKAGYFYRPIGWHDNAYTHNIYTKYPRPAMRPEGPRPPRGPKPEGPRPGGPRFDNGPRHYGNNSPEAKHMRKEMRKRMKKGAR